MNTMYFFSQYPQNALEMGFYIPLGGLRKFAVVIKCNCREDYEQKMKG